MKNVVSRIIAGLSLSLTLMLTLTSLRAQQSAPMTSAVPTANAEAAAELRQRTFEVVWKTINDKHFDPNFNGVDWKGVHTRYAPLVAAVKDDNELYLVLTKMLCRLKESHFSILPPPPLYNPCHLPPQPALPMQ